MRLRDIPLPVKLLLSILLPPFFLIIWGFASAMDLSSKMKNATNNPNELTVGELIEVMERVIISFNNHPDSWRQVRNTWYVINGSNRVPTAYKERVLHLFKKKGLRVSNSKIINNYKKNAY